MSDCGPGPAMMTAGIGSFGPQDRPDFGLEYGHGHLHGHGPMMVTANGVGPGGPPNGPGDIPRLEHEIMLNRLDRDAALGLDRLERVGGMSERMPGEMGHYIDQAQTHGHFGHLDQHHHHPSGHPGHDRLLASPPRDGCGPPHSDHRQIHHSSNSNNISTNNNNSNTTNNNTNSDIRHDNRFDRPDGGPDNRLGGTAGNGRPSGPDYSNSNILGVAADANMNTKQCPNSGPLHPLMGPHDTGLEGSDLKGDHCNGYSPYTMLHDRAAEEHHRRPMPPLTTADIDTPGFCAGCGGRILDRYYLHAVEKQWHMHCLTCTDCHFRLDSEITCFAKDGNIYCKTDYYRRFAVKNCARCQQPISANELIMRAREQVFHLTCFACTACHRTLKSGEQYGLRDGLLYCRMDYELMFQGEFGMAPGGHLSPGILGAGGGGHLSPGGGGHGGGGGGGGAGGGHISFYNGVGAVQKGRPRKRKMQLPDPDGCPPL
ncbi:LIM/homeobox protein lhx9, partial [Plakobranchus ocellatus]